MYATSVEYPSGIGFTFAMALPSGGEGYSLRRRTARRLAVGQTRIAAIARFVRGRLVRGGEHDGARVSLGRVGGRAGARQRRGLLLDARERVTHASLRVGLGRDVASQRDQLAVEQGAERGAGRQLLAQARAASRVGAGED